MRSFVSLLLWLTVAQSAFGQSYGDPAYKQKFNKADALIYNGAFMDALPLLEELHASDSSIANINYMLGVCHLNGSKNFRKAIRLLENASKDVSKNFVVANWKEKKAPGITYLYLGRAYHYLNDFERAVSNYYNYRSFLDVDDIDTYNKVRMVIKHAENAIELVAAPVNVKIVNLGDAVNTSFAEYAPVMAADGQSLFFTSNRTGGVTDVKDKDGAYYDDIYVSTRKSDGKWGRPNMVSGINTAGNEATAGITPDGQTLFLFKEDNGIGNIYYSELKDNAWSVPAKMGSDINSASRETSATVSVDGNILIFASNRPGGYGGSDLWFCSRLPDGSWGLAQNLGSVVNTMYDEESPFLGFDGKTLFFSSQGHTSMGGFDVFRSELVNGTWLEPQNLGYPINTSEDDLHFVLAADGETAFLSSAREGGLGETDIYTLRLTPRKAEAKAVARGEMLVPANDYVKLKAVISVKDATGNVIGTFRPNRRTGTYILLLNPGESYTAEYLVEGYDAVVENIQVGANAAYAATAKPIELETVVFGAELLALQAEKKRAEAAALSLAAKAEEDRKLAEEARLKAEADAEANAKQLAMQEEKQAEVEKARLLAEAEAEAAKAELKTAENEAKKAEEARLAQEAAAKKAAADAAREAELAAEAKKAEEARLAQEAAAKKAAADAAREAELAAEAKKARLAQEAAAKKAAADAAREAELAAEAKKVEEARLAQEAAAKKTAADAAREAEPAAEAKKAEEARLALEAESKKAASAREAELAAEAKKAEEARLAQEAAAKKAASEAAREAELAAEAKKAEEARLAQEAAAKKAASEAAREAELAAEAKKAEEARLAQEAAAKKAAADAAREAELAAEAKEAEEARLAREAAETSAASSLNQSEEALKRAALQKRLEELKKKKAEMEEALVQERQLAVEALEQRSKEEAQKQREQEEAARQAEIAEKEKAKAESAKAAEAKLAEERKAKEAAEAKAREEAAAKSEAARQAEIAEKAKAEAESAKAAEAKLAEERKAKELSEAKVRAEAETKKAENQNVSQPSTNNVGVDFSQSQIREVIDANRRLISENESLRTELEQMNAKLDLILAELKRRNEMMELPLDTYSEDAVQALTEGKKLILQNILFDYNKARLRGSSERELDRLAAFLIQHPDINLTVAGHTDALGEAGYNLRLSRSRAEAVVNHLVSKGVDAARLKSVGYGQTKPIARNTNPDGVDNPLGRQLNRRIEISVTKGDADLIEIREEPIPDALQK